MTELPEQCRILCVEKGRDLARQVRLVLPEERVELAYERSLYEVVDRFERESFDIMLFSGMVAREEERDALDILELISAKCPLTQVLFFVEPGQMHLARSALQAGSFHYAKLPVSDLELRVLIESSLAQQPRIGPNLLLKEEVDRTTFQSLIGQSEAMQSVFRQIRQAAATDIPVLLTGETGTGKELAAHAIHQESVRAELPYVPVHLGALPADLVPSELLGHEKGAFTGAVSRKAGCFEQAGGGTVFLDEISTIDGRIQISLLRLLEHRAFQRIGGGETLHADVRVISASNVDLMDEVREGRFREDLFFRLDVLHIHLPPLRERKGDIALLIEHFLQQTARRFRKEIRGIAPECLARLEAYSWPGNVRELKNAIQRAVVMCTGDILLSRHLPARLASAPRRERVVTVPVGTSLAEMERTLIARTLEQLGNNRTKTANVLGISRRALYNKLRRHGLDAPEGQGAGGAAALGQR